MFAKFRAREGGDPAGKFPYPLFVLLHLGCCVIRLLRSNEASWLVGAWEDFLRVCAWYRACTVHAITRGTMFGCEQNKLRKGGMG